MKLYLFFLLLPAMDLKAQPGDGIAPGRLSAVGIDSASIVRLAADIDNGTYPNIHSLLIARHNQLVYEHYWKGKDETLGDDLGVIAHGRDSLHDMRSVTKSFVGTCIGIAIGQGKIMCWSSL